MSKVSASVLVIWVVIGVSLATLYPIAQTTIDRQIDGDFRNTSQTNNPDNSQSSFDSPNSLFNFDIANTQSVSGSGNSQSGSGLGNNPPGDDLGNPDDSGNKYLADNFFLSLLNFTALITNPQNRVTGDGYYEIKTNPSANHQNVLQNGTFAHSIGTFTINSTLKFTPVNNTKYHILVYTNYPEHDNRVSKDDYTYSS